MLLHSSFNVFHMKCKFNYEAKRARNKKICELGKPLPPNQELQKTHTELRLDVQIQKRARMHHHLVVTKAKRSHGETKKYAFSADVETV